MIYNNNFVDVNNNVLKISPKTWLHQCTVLNTRSGKVTVVVNGEIIQNGIIDFFADPGARPRSLKGINIQCQFNMNDNFF